MAKADPITSIDRALSGSIVPLIPSSGMGDMAERLSDVLSALRRAVKDIEDEVDITGDGTGVCALVNRAQEYAECLRAFVTQSKTRWDVFAEDDENLKLAKLVNETGGAH